MNNKLYLMLFAGVATCLCACRTGKSVRQAVHVAPSPCFVTPDSVGQACLDATFRIPAHYFNRRSRLIIVPQLVKHDSVWDEYAPLVVDAPVYGKKLERRRLLEGYQDPYARERRIVDKTSRFLSMPYHQVVSLPEEAEGGRIVAVVTTDGCGECTGLDTVDVAAVNIPTTLIEPKKELKLNWIEPRFKIRPKIREGKGEALLQFLINRHDINLELGRNKDEMDKMLATLRPIVADSLAMLTSVVIDGMASADGSLAYNTMLAEKRAMSAKDWLLGRLDIDREARQCFRVGSRPEGWNPVLQAMVADQNPDSAAVKEILTRHAAENDDVQERHIRRLPCWNTIKEKYLQKDRKVEYVYSYSIRSFTTDSEMLAMYGTRPDAFNEEELLRVSTLKATPAEKKEVYATLLHYFPQSAVAANNLAVLLLREEKQDEAEAVLRRLDDYSPEAINALAAVYVYGNRYEKAIELLQTNVELPEARYNLGLLKARMRHLQEAYRLLRPFADLNAAIVALSLNRNAEADAIMQAVADSSPRAEYVRALAAARRGDRQAASRHLEAARKDPALARRALSEADFSLLNSNL